MSRSTKFQLLACLFITFFLAFCRSDEKEHFVVSDLIADFDVAIKQTIPSDVAFKQGIYDRKLLSDRLPIRADREVFAAGQQSELSFFSYAGAPFLLKIRCRPVKLIDMDDSQQVISIFLNSTQIATLSLNPGWSVNEVELPAHLLQLGENFLRFEYEHAGTPADASDRRGKGILSVAFSDISISDPTRKTAPRTEPIQNVDGKILQPSDSVLIYYSRVPGNSQLKLDIEDMGKELEAHISVESEDEERLDIVLDRSGPAVLDLAGFSDQIVKITLYGKPQSDNGDFSAEQVVWSEIKIVNGEGKERITFADEELREERKKLSTQKYDVFYVVLDAFYAEHASLYGYHRETTPFLEQLGKKSVIFSNFFAHSPYTLASTGTLLTSKYPHRHGLTRMKAALQKGLLNLPKALSADDVDSYLISDHTFLTSEEWGLNRDYTKVIMKGSYTNSLEEVVEALNEVYFEEKGDNRKFIYLHLIPPHRPYEPPEEFRIFNTAGAKEIDNFQRFLANIKKGNISPSEEELNYIESMYDANVLYADAIVKGIYEFLEGNGLLDRTILIVTSDHGEASRMEHGELGHNTTLYDEMIHIPFVVKLPDPLGQKYRTVQSVAAIVDVAPTILELFGMNPVDGFEGRSLLPRMFGDDTEAKSYVFLENPGKRQLGIRGQDHKYISTFQQKLLFDLRIDPEERQNLYAQKRIVAGYYEQMVSKEYEFQPIEDQEESANLEGLSEEQKRKLRELGYVQ